MQDLCNKAESGDDNKLDELNDLIYYTRSAPNDDGWRCCSCQRSFGDSKKLDEKMCALKISCLLLELQEEKFIYISNESEGCYIETQVQRKCNESSDYSQHNIIFHAFEVTSA